MSDYEKTAEPVEVRRWALLEGMPLLMRILVVAAVMLAVGVPIEIFAGDMWAMLLDPVWAVTVMGVIRLTHGPVF